MQITWVRVENPDYLELGGKLLWYFLVTGEMDVSLLGQYQKVWINVLSMAPGHKSKLGQTNQKQFSL